MSPSLETLSLLHHVVHLALMAFLLFGWIPARTLKLHLIAIIIVWLSWIGIGWYIGFLGYCILTDLHWQVLAEMARLQGQAIHLPPSYVEYLYWLMGGGDIPDGALSNGIAAVFVALTGVSVYRNVVRVRTCSTKVIP